MAECYISKKNWETILNYSKSSYNQFKAEIGGMAIMIKDNDDDWVLKEPVILKQAVTAGSTSIDKSALASYYTKVGMKWNPKNVEFRFCWWHSHHTMAAFWSGTDLATINDYEGSDLSFALVVNLKGEYKFRISVWEPFEMHKDVELTIMGKAACIPAKINAEVTDLCSKPVDHWTARGVNSENGYYKEYKRTSYLSSDQQTTIFPDTAEEKMMKEYNYLLELQADFQDKLIDGQLVYSKYLSGISNLNEQLEKRGSEFRLKQFPNPIEDTLYTEMPDAFITDVHNNVIAPVDDFDVRTQNLKEVDDWNHSFGVL